MVDPGIETEKKIKGGKKARIRMLMDDNDERC